MNATLRTLLGGFVFAALACVPVWQTVMHQETAPLLPLGWLGIGLDTMAIFFHELGHTATAWFYGIPTLPSFDFSDGGGMSYYFEDRPQIWLVGCVWAGLAYGIYVFRSSRFMAAGLGCLLVLNLATFRNEDIALSIIDFMGSGAEVLTGGFFIFRAVFNLTPRGGAERFLSAGFGFGFLLRAFIIAGGLLYNQAHRLLYYTQKGSHGFGDFDKIAERFYNLSFEGVVSAWMGLAILCLAVPFLMTLFWPPERGDYSS